MTLNILKKAVLSGKELARYQLFWAIVAGGVSASALGIAMLSEYVGGLQPCVLCVYQRWPHLAIIIIAGLVTGLTWRRNAHNEPIQNHVIAGLFALAAIMALTGMGLAAYHVGVEYGWWQGSAACSAPLGAQSIDDLRARLLAAPVVRCDEVAWSFLGLSMASYNGIVSLFLAIICTYAAFISLVQHTKE